MVHESADVTNRHKNSQGLRGAITENALTVCRTRLPCLVGRLPKVLVAIATRTRVLSVTPSRNVLSSSLYAAYVASRSSKPKARSHPASARWRSQGPSGCEATWWGKASSRSPASCTVPTP